jgi:outer membrane protein insertion porin family
MFRKIFQVNFIFFFIASMSVAEIITDIKIFGNKRLSKESIIVFGDIKFGINYQDEDLNNILKKIYDTNFFQEINLDINNSILEIKVVENPIIEDVEINGITSKKLTELLMEKIKLKNRNSYIESSFLADVNLVKNIIRNAGYYFADIKTSSTLNESQNSVRLIYDIDLGSKAKIKDIQFIGDKKIKDRKLKNIITTEESKFWKFISQSVYLNYERIELDKRLLTNFYKNKGYYNAVITNSFVEFNNDNSFKLIFNINAGNKFKFNNVNLILSDDYDEKYFTEISETLVKLKDRDYSLNKIEKVLREVDKIALTRQYQFINAILDEKIIGDNKLDIAISLKDNEKYYVEKINIFGNNYTLEEVIRNSLIVDEGDPYNEILFNKSINRIKSKNIFSIVESEIISGSKEGLKVVNLTVEEKATGEISLGAGIGSSGGTIGGGIKENNFLGKGIKLDTNLQVTKNSVRGIFVYEKPNFNYSENSLFTSVRSTSEDNLIDFGYETSNLGISLGTSFEQYENLYFKPELSLSHEELKTNSTASSSLKKQKGNYLDVYFNYSFNYDLRDKSYKTEEGFQNEFYQELPVVSESYEIVNSFTSSRYQKISSMVTKISFYGSAVNTLNNEDVRISKRLFIPGNKLRGFEAGKIGPIENGAFVGGNYISAVNISATLPQVLPSIQNIDFAVFFDTANVWGVDYDSKINDSSKIRSSAGIAMDVATPVGPLTFSLSQAISKKSSDVTETFRFNLGTTF